MLIIDKIKNFVEKTIRFFTYDIWRLKRSDITPKKFGLYNLVKAFILAIRNIDSSELNTRAAALTYRTLLSIVPMLAVLFAIARGFGFQNLVETELFSYFEGQAGLLEKAMSAIDNSIKYAQGGIFVGVGVVLLLYTVINLLSSIEDNFNTIWHIKKGRSYYRQFTDYMALIILMPVVIILNAGLSIILNSAVDIAFMEIVVSPVIKLIPFFITILLFTFVYIYIPNTKVNFIPALIAGSLAGIAFQIFQMFYISGQIWISKYNAIYGTFAALPLLLLWLQLSWFICLFGVELSFAFQNVDKFNFEHETKNISRRYKDFITLTVTGLICKRFEKGLKPYTADEISTEHEIPTKLLSDILYFLLEINIITETKSDIDRVPAYIPALDINRITVAYLFEKIDNYGSEDFKIDKIPEFKDEWNKILEIRALIIEKEKAILVKDL